MTHYRAANGTLGAIIAVGSVISADLLTGVDSTAAQDADRVEIDARRCIAIESAEERLACFESQVDDALAESPSDATATPAPAARPAPNPASSSTPPRRPESVRTVDIGGGRQQRNNDDTAETEIIGSITSLAQRQPNRYLITLDSGDVWLQTVAERYPMRVGQRVRIYSTRWGAHQRLQADGVNGFIQVERVR